MYAFVIDQSENAFIAFQIMDYNYFFGEDFSVGSEEPLRSSVSLQWSLDLMCEKLRGVSFQRHIPIRLGKSQSYGRNVFRVDSPRLENTFPPYDWLLLNPLGSVQRGSRSKNNLRHITYGKEHCGGYSLFPLSFLLCILIIVDITCSTDQSMY